MLISKRPGRISISRLSRTDVIKASCTSSALIFCALLLLFSLLVAPVAYGEVASSQEAEQVCRNWLTQIVFQKGAWAGETDPRVTAVHEIRSGDTLLARYYDISPTGFVVVPVLKEMTPVKAYSDVSVLDERQEGGLLLLLKEVFQDRYGLYLDRYGSLDAVQPAVGDAVFGQGHRAAWDRLVKPTEEFKSDLLLQRLEPMDEAGPLLTTSWHQGAPYNNLCPMGDGGRCVVGCVATATAQILNYWQWPANGRGSHSYTWAGDNSCGGSTPSQVLSADYSDAYDWTNMADSCDMGCSPAEEAALEELNYEVGVAEEMMYGACGSGAYMLQAQNAYPTYFYYSDSIRTVYRPDYSLAGWFSQIQEEINAGRPIQYAISRHSIVCDGWRDNGGQYEYHMNYGWGGSQTLWFVLDSLYCYWEDNDHCPPEQDLMILNIHPQTEPIIQFVGQTIDDSAGDNDGHADLGESVQLSLTIRNRGWNAVNVTGELTTSDPHISISTAEAGFGDSIPWGGEAASQTSYAFSVDPSCPDPHIAVFKLEISATGGYLTTDSFYIFIGDTPDFRDNMESGQGFWTHGNATSMYYDEWHLETCRSHTAGTSWKTGGPDTTDFYKDLSDAALMTPPFLLSDSSILSFWHWIDAETGGGSTAWDGAIIMISSGDGQWTQVTPDGGYPYTIIDNPASPFDPATPCFSGSYGWSEVECDLSAYSGVVQIMFRFGSDGYTNREGWYVDDVKVAPLSCCVDTTGNIDCDPAELCDIDDLTRLIDYMFISFDPLCCPEEANVSGDPEGLVDIDDLTRLIDYLFISFTPPAECQW